MALLPELILRDVWHVHQAGEAGRPRRATAEEHASNMAKLRAWEHATDQKAADAAGMSLEDWVAKEGDAALRAEWARIEAENAANAPAWDQCIAEKRAAEVPDGERPDWLVWLENQAKRRAMISRAKQALAKAKYAKSERCKTRRRQNYRENRERILAYMAQWYADKVLARKEQEKLTRDVPGVESAES
jgi:hypothetical protein